MIDKSLLERLYLKYNRRDYVHPDPLEFLYSYRRLGDREIVGLAASALAYGRVAQILASVRKVLAPMQGRPREFLGKHSYHSLTHVYSGFKHRFAGRREISALLACAGTAISKHGSLNKAFLSVYDPVEPTVIPALTEFVKQFDCAGEHLLPDPGRGSACKRLNLFMRWMVRKDLVDPGGWKGVSSSSLVVPLDTHMARIGMEHGMTSRKSPGIRMAADITEFFRRIEPSDPVKYDFALTRFGIRSDMNAEELGGKPGG